MAMIKAVLLLAAVGLVACADDTAEVRSVVRDFNRASQKPDPRLFASLFTPDADYRDSMRILKGREALVALFASRQRWSERTAPMLQDVEIRIVGAATALVDGQIVQYGTTLGKSAVRVVLVLLKEDNQWKISSWRTVGSAILMFPG